MLTTRKPMKRSGFKRKEPISFDKPASPGASVFDIERYAAERDQRLAERAARQMATASASPDNVAMGPNAIQAAPVEKESPLRSEPYRRLVAALPCAHCGIAGYSQCAHANTGKGTGTKSSDTESFPLCACQPGRRGCHSLFDQGALFSKEARRAKEAEWVAKTRLQILSSGLWPARLPVPNN